MGKTYHDRFYYTDEDFGAEPDLVHKEAYAAQLKREAAIWARRNKKGPESDVP